MSDIQDLIHKTSMDCIERGKVIERERIIKLLESQQDRYGEDYFHITNIIELIKGGSNE